ncbi:MAG: MBL fold metallo-hydrolase [Balneolaceae bacterium]|nr:MBL fold metallo-hydrolase [Balneolaceae bacterium]
MKVGRFTIEQLSEGIFEVYDGNNFKKVSSTEITGKTKDLPDFGFVPTVGIDPILVLHGNQVILLDTGLGWGLDKGSSYTNTSNLITNLDIFGLTPEDVTHVVLTHLHFDHAAGSTFVNSKAETNITLPNAHYFVQKLEWYYAIEQAMQADNIAATHYQMDELYKLHAEDKLVLITDSLFELLPGIQLIHTGGHTPGHQIVKIFDEEANEFAYYLGDLLPSEAHLNHYFMQSLDVDPLAAKKAKTILLRQAFNEQATLLFYHSIYAKAGVLFKDENKQYAIEPVNMSY